MHSLLKKQSTRYADNVNHILHQCKIPSYFENRFYIVKKEMNDIYYPIWKMKWNLLSENERETLFHSFEKSIQTIEMALDYFFPKSFPIDIPLLEYKLGQPISMQEARKEFIEPKINIPTLETLDMYRYDRETKKIFDVIQMEWMDVSEFVQLRNTNEFMSRSVFETLLENSKTTWCGKQNIGFKSPYSDMIFGNLVLYNYDRMQFFPQKAGILLFQQIKNTMNLPCMNKPKKVIPSHYWKGTYFSYSFYIPDTSEGRMVLCLMKDCFKKGNLFAFQSNRIHHGRIHKKTSLTGIYGYPDDTYLERVIGELSNLGSTPYTYQFSSDASFIVHQDPYPLEKRFQLDFKYNITSYSYIDGGSVWLNEVIERNDDNNEKIDELNLKKEE